MLMLPPPPRAKKRKAQTVLDEDTYISSMTKIIERDFFPGLPKLRRQIEVMEAVDSNDVQRLRELHAKFTGQRTSDVRGK
eukprot:SAG31_NODE_21915_length_538_cov_0.674260_1_plen_79_part_01